ncbi:uncharacterized protein Hap1MRO34_004498 [Clarias gariepinus]
MNFNMFRVSPIKKVYVMVLGKTLNSHKPFLDALTTSPNLCEVSSVKDSDVIIAFVPNVSRTGTDLSAAMEKIPDGKPVVLVVLHHTFDPYKVVPDSRRCINNERVFAVDCLFHEDQGLLRCPRNDDANRAVKKHLRIPEVDYLRIRIIICVGVLVLIAVAFILISYVPRPTNSSSLN